MQTKHIQWFLASVFFILGGWALVAPQSVINLTLRPEYRTDTLVLPFAIGCFGAQAMISGLFAAFSKFTKNTFLAYGIALIPFFVFDYYFYFVVPIFTIFGMSDAVGNVIMLVLCVVGYKNAAKS